MTVYSLGDVSEIALKAGLDADLIYDVMNDIAHDRAQFKMKMARRTESFTILNYYDLEGYRYEIEHKDYVLLGFKRIAKLDVGAHGEQVVTDLMREQREAEKLERANEDGWGNW